MWNRWRQTRRRRRAQCPECGAPRLMAERLDRYRVEREELWTAVETLTADRDQLVRRLSGVVEHVPDYPPPPGPRHLSVRAGAWGRPEDTNGSR